jgi:PHD/YefM family antitoxin component YafN of YafNO toxin-antitoxin module
MPSNSDAGQTVNMTAQVTDSVLYQANSDQQQVVIAGQGNQQGYLPAPRKHHTSRSTVAFASSNN